MVEEIRSVKDFNITSGLVPVSDFSNTQMLDLKLGLIKEETAEIEEAALKGDVVGVLDGIVDLLYVTLGFAVTYNLDTVLPEAFNRVHQSNMSKFCKTKGEAIKTMQAYSEKGIQTTSRQVGTSWVIFRATDDKILKSINYTPVELNDLCQNQN